MSLTPEEVKKIAHLARLGVDEDKLPEYAAEMSNVLDLVAQMNSADTDGIEPMAHPGHATNRLRDDVVSETNLREQLQSPAPSVEKGLFLVPKVIE